MDQRHVLIRFKLEEDFYRCWLWGLWMIQEFPMRVFKWAPDFKLHAESSHAPVWIGLEGLLVHFFDKVALFSIASVIGVPLKIDVATATLAHPTVARICVDVDLCGELPQRVWIGIANDGFWQYIEHENLPSYCAHCRKQGHGRDIYRKLLLVQAKSREEVGEQVPVLHDNKGVAAGSTGCDRRASPVRAGGGGSDTTPGQNDNL
ncbi:uncharacterized protein LOC113777158 [Coffea eugenioides]|uniref:uncharacterized protein LOC113777158 n=1 Tax=Coffea eugenioides TaxID=49369 RepID=UPI000F612630|nr:uncharacterized protein LOC113777158 [Coffea eugenioides]